MLAPSLAGLLLLACRPDPSDHGPIAEDIAARLGEPVPYATPEQLDTFERGKAVGERRFARSEGLGPAFNVTFCVSCHERPVTGGSAGLYRNFFLAGTKLADGSYVPTKSAGEAAGVVRSYYFGEDEHARPALDESVNVFAQRNPIPFFGVGLLAELDESVILAHADEDDADGDGISGRPNFDRGFVGRFGRKAQTVSIEGFIRGPLFNHLGITTDPLTEEQKSRLPVDSSGGEAQQVVTPLLLGLLPFGQAAAPETSLIDDDGVADPELPGEDLFDLVSFAMLMAAPDLESLSEAGVRGRAHFDALGCGDCHVPRLEGPRGPLPVYSDLLLHDMGPELADDQVPGVAEPAEFRTQPLWGLASVGPYLHDGRAQTLRDAILMHAGEAQAARDRADALDDDEMDDLVEFLESLGGRDQTSPGLIPPDAEEPEPGALGGSIPGLDADGQARFAAGRAVFDREFGRADGVGGPRLNGDSCRACHFEPVVGGAGPLGVNVMRHGIINGNGEFVPPSVGTILHKSVALENQATLPQDAVNVFEHRNTPPLFGLGLIAGIPDATILANADPDDAQTPDGITGRPSWTDAGRLGRFGWKSQVPTLEEFVRDAVTMELGMTLPYVEGLTFGRVHDNDDVADPEMDVGDADALQFYMESLAPPARAEDADDLAVVQGEQVFADTGCASCHIPALDGPDGPVPLYSDLLLHEILPFGATGIEETSANMREFRTPPLWGLRHSAPYLHSGEAETIADAIALHDGEAVTVRMAYEALNDADRDALLRFLGSL
jgi:CxxC motif-containing protein (DUF1111 family)